MFPDRLNIVVFLTIALPAVWCVFGVISVFTSDGNYTFNRSQAEGVVDEIRTGKICPNATGEVEVPHNLVSQGWYDQAFVGHGLNHPVFFITHWVRSDWDGYLYCSGAPSQAGKGEIWVPFIEACRLDAPPSHQVSSHWWYCVHRGHGW